MERGGKGCTYEHRQTIKGQCHENIEIVLENTMTYDCTVHTSFLSSRMHVIYSGNVVGHGWVVGSNPLPTISHTVT